MKVFHTGQRVKVAKGTLGRGNGTITRVAPDDYWGKVYYIDIDGNEHDPEEWYAWIWLTPLPPLEDLANAAD